MVEELDLETYLHVSNKKFEIFLFDKRKRVNLYKDKIVLKINFDFQDFSDLSKFLDKNIYQIEKLTGIFIKNIYLIIEYKENLTIKIGKKKTFENTTNKKSLKNILIELKSLINENYQNQTIMHILLNDNIKKNDKNFSFSSNETVSEYLEIDFLTISNNLIFLFDKILEKYQIKITKFFDGNYVINFSKDNTIELSITASKLDRGENKNEVILIPKNVENKGFFEKFFQLFS
jgi:hypothetical protein|tara:strand:+ start:2573 stop:3271 length:699 start_codon:yes stop_codon:yes gene_type:complete